MNGRYNHILVPLDGSELAELAVADALDVATMSQAQVTLLWVIRPIDHVIAADTGHPIYIDEQLDTQREAAMEYLTEVGKQFTARDLTVHKVVEVGGPPEIIIDFADHQPIDLIVMATHGRSGLQRWVYGSVADKVLRGASVPILLVRTHANQPGN